MSLFSLARGLAVAAAAVATCTAMHADAIRTVGVHIGSHHAPARDYQNFNPGAYVRFNSGLTVGGYHNSERRTSLYAGYTLERGPFAVTLGAITGYRRANVLPLVVPSVAIGRLGPATMRLAVLPKLESGGATVVHLMAEF